MPYKEKRKQVNKDSQRKRRGDNEGVTEQGVTQETVPQSYVPGLTEKGLTSKFKSLPKRPRYLTLSDGQVLDRLNQPQPNTQGSQPMQRCNESSYNFKPRKR